MTVIDTTQTVPWEERDWGARQYGVDLGLNPMTESVVDMCQRILVDSPDPNARTLCPGHQAMVWNPDVTPKWIIDETAGRSLYQSDLGWPGIARFGEYVNWGRLLRDHDDLILDGYGSSQFRPLTLEMIAVCDELRAQGLTARLDVDLEIEAVDKEKPIFGLEATGIIIDDEDLEARVDVDAITQRLTPPSIEALNPIDFRPSGSRSPGWSI